MHGRGLARGLHCGLVHNTASKALTIERAFQWLSTVAPPGSVAGGRVGCVAHTGVVAFDDLTHVLGTTVADLQCASIEDLVQLVAFWKVLVDQR